MAITKPQVSDFKTKVYIWTNLDKQNGYTKAGAGYLDGYVEYDSRRGKFYQRSGSRALATGAVLPTYAYTLIIRFDTAISNIVDPQMRFVIKGKSYTLDGYDISIWDRESFFVFYLNEFK